MTSVLFIRHIPLVGYWNRETASVVANFSEATRYTQEEINSLDLRYLFPSERWVRVAE